MVVSWNSEPHLRVLFPSLPPGARVTLVDNASTDGSAPLAHQARFTVLRLSRNEGFGPACNRAVTEESAPFDAILLLNPDTEWLSGTAGLEKLYSELFAGGSTAAVAPALEGDGQAEFQLRKLPSLGSLAREAFLVNRLWPKNPWLRRERYLFREPLQALEVEQPAAAALLVKASVFRDLGGFDPQFFPAWFEDVDFCARIKKAGFAIRYVPAVRVRHTGGSTMRALAYRDYLPLYTRNLFRYLGKHEPAWKTGVARAILALGTVLRIGLLLGFRGDHTRRDAWAAYFRVLAGLAGLGWRTSLAESPRV